MSTVLAEFLILLVLLLVNGLFAMSEMAIVSSRRVRLERRADRGDRGARVALEMAAEPTRFLSAVQVGITLIGVLSGAFGGATIAEQLAARLTQVPALAAYADAIALTVVVAVISYLSLVIGELVPKRIALNDPERIAAAVARPMRAIAHGAGPLVTLLTRSTNLVLRTVGARSGRAQVVTEEEIRALVEQGAEAGVVTPGEHELVESVFSLGDRQAATIMTPRPDMEWLDLTAPKEEIRAALAAARSATVLACDGSLDRVVGILDARDLLSRALAGAALDTPDELRALAQPPLYMPGTMPVLSLLDRLRTARQQVALVLDEYGSVEGVVTLDDILEALVGELPGREDEEQPQVVRRDDGSWLVDGALPVDDLAEMVGIDPPPMDERRGYRTVAGFILTRLGHMPIVGESVTWEGNRYEVVDLDGRRIDKVLVRPAPE